MADGTLTDDRLKRFVPRSSAIVPSAMREPKAKETGPCRR
jgi:hypothetical protein